MITCALAAEGCAPRHQVPRAEFERVRAEAARLRAERDATTAKYQNLLALLNELQGKLKSITADHAELEKLLAALRAKIAEAGASSLDELITQLSSTLKAMNAYASAFEEIKASVTAKGLPVKVTIRNGRLMISLPEAILFDSGKAALRISAPKVLVSIASIIATSDALKQSAFQAQGHTDDIPYKGPHGDNLGLSQARAASVVRFLTGEGKSGAGLPARNWSAAGFGDTDPIEPNDTPIHREANRRVDLAMQVDITELLRKGSQPASGGVSCRPVQNGNG